MGLFDFLKPKRTGLEKTFAKLEKDFFPGGQKQKEDGAREIMRLSNGKLDFKQAFGLFVKAKARLNIASDKSEDRMIKGIIIDSENKLTYPEATNIFKFVLFGIEEPNKEEDAGLMEFLKMGFGMNSDGVDADEIPDGYGEFGYAVTNPIPVKGILSNETYLSRIRTDSNEKIQWKRIGSFQADNSENPIDGYIISKLSGSEIATIYISPYHKRISNKAPKGFKLSNN